MSKSELDSLVNAIKKWDNETNLKSKNVWNKNKVARLLASIMRREKHWKINYPKKKRRFY